VSGEESLETRAEGLVATFVALADGGKIALGQLAEGIGALGMRLGRKFLARHGKRRVSWHQVGEGVSGYCPDAVRTEGMCCRQLFKHRDQVVAKWGIVQSVGAGHGGLRIDAQVVRSQFLNSPAQIPEESCEVKSTNAPRCTMVCWAVWRGGVNVHGQPLGISGL